MLVKCILVWYSQPLTSIFGLGYGSIKKMRLECHLHPSHSMISCHDNLLQLICLTFFLLQFTFNIPSPSSNLLQSDHFFFFFWQTDHLLPESHIYLGWHIDTGQCHCTVEIFNNLTPPHKHWHGNKPSFCATLFSQTNLVKLKIEFFYLTNNGLASYEAINHTEHS